MKPKDNKFNLFTDSIWNVTKFDMVTLSNVFEHITTDRYKAITAKVRAARKDKIADEKGSPYSVLKSSTLDYVTFNGEFKIIPDLDKSGKQKIDKSGELKFTARCEAAIKYLSGYYIIDIDHLTPDNLTALKEDLKQDAKLGVQLMFISPGGDGLKIVVKIDTALVDLTLISAKMGNYWAAFNQYFATNYADLITPNKKGEFIDGACKDVSRACFLCHAPEAYLNENDTVHGQSFLDEYKPVEKKTTARKKELKPISLTVNPATTLKELAARHLLETDNRTGELLSFIGAAKAIGAPVEATLNYILHNVSIAPISSKASGEAIEDMVTQVYTQYGKDNEGQHLTAESFAYGILVFKYSTTVKQYVAKQLFAEGFINLLHEHGFYRRKVNGIYIFIRKEGRMITQVTPKEIQTFISLYVDTLKDGYTITYQGQNIHVPFIAIKQIYLNNTCSIFNDNYLQNLKVDDQPILKDKRHCSYFVFQNCMVTVTKDGINTEDLKGLKGDFCYWNTQMLKRDFTYNADYKNCDWYSFMQNVCNHSSERFLSMATGLGYAIHAYFNPLVIPALIFVDEAITEKNEANGGSGKGLCLDAIAEMRNTTIIDGRGLNPDNSFFLSQVKVDTRIVAFDDIKPDLPFVRFYSMVTTGMTVENKNKDKFKFSKEDNPKIIITSNQMLKNSGKSDIRRSFYIEVSDHYSRAHSSTPILDEHGCTFFSDEWNNDEWNKFYSTMLFCSVQYLKEGLKKNAGVNIEKNRLLQNTSLDFVEWMEAQKLQLNERHDIKQCLSAFTSLYYKDGQGIAQKTFTTWVKSYVISNGLMFERKESNNKTYFIITKHIK